MKIALLSGAFKNAGDFLIEKRCRELLQYCYPEAEISLLMRNEKYDSRIDEINSYDLVVFGGGPGFRKNYYPGKVPFVSNLDEVKVPCCILGWGWKADNISHPVVYKNNYFDSRMKEFLEFINRNHAISCRDIYTQRMLLNQGLEGIMMTGCPAWYDTKRVADLKYKGCDAVKEKNPYIIISDAAYKKNLKYTQRLIVLMRQLYPEARIKVLFHRGINSENTFLTEKIFTEKYNFEYEDISGSADGFSQYDECDLHIGFRVHAHIYNLSHGKTTILLNEDARGFGVNDAMGLPNIVLDKYMEKEVENIINLVKYTDGNCYQNAVSNIKVYFNRMEQFLKGLL